MTPDELDELVDVDPLRLRDEAIRMLRALEDVRRIAGTGKVCPSDAAVIRRVEEVLDKA